ncbi:hypothetical protein BS17DRAFT_762996 [Gyrodon lividus]|nr:hypothetical protein BS17DRAFT_762996 [Gyrodon lividus]
MYLKTMKKDKHIQASLNACALKICIQEQVHHHKFEIEHLECSYRNTINEHKLHMNAQSSIKHREPTILKLVKAYNAVCDNIHALMQVGRAPHDAIPPRPILCEDLFKLDIDNDIWLDVVVEGDVGIPLACWIIVRRRSGGCQDNVLSCKSDLQESGQAPFMLRKLQHQKDGLASVYVQWESKVCHITTAWKMGPLWGPTSSKVAHAVYTQCSLGGEDGKAKKKDKEEDVGSDEGSGLEDDNDVGDAVEDMALAEEYGL